MARSRARPSRRDEVRANARQKGELKAKQDEIDALEVENRSQAETISSLAARIATLEAQMTNRTARITNLEEFRTRSVGFAPAELVPGNFTENLNGVLLGQYLKDATVGGGKLALRTVGGGRISLGTITTAEINMQNLDTALQNRGFTKG